MWDWKSSPSSALLTDARWLWSGGDGGGDGAGGAGGAAASLSWNFAVDAPVPSASRRRPGLLV